jgi:hypothetical protein
MNFEQIESLTKIENPQPGHQLPAMFNGESGCISAKQILSTGGEDDPQALKDFSNVDPETGRSALGLQSASERNVGLNPGDLPELVDGGGGEGVLPPSTIQGYRLRGAPIVLTTSGTYTPDAAVKALLVELQGGGGAGGQAGTTSSSQVAYAGSGAGGGYCSKIITSPVAATVTIGAGGAAGPTPSAGGNTTYDDGTVTLAANGGTAGSNRGPIAEGSGIGAGGGVGGAATGGDINVPGVMGGPGASLPTVYGFSGLGGASRFGSGGGHARTATAAEAVAGKPGTGFGSGGSGGANSRSQTATDGGNGAGGVVIIWEFI